MYKQIGIILVLILPINIALAQTKLSYPEVDKTSYELFLKGNWQELINYSELARQQGIDFFYLKARTGIAYYNMGKYRFASNWFLKAWETDKSPEWLQEYLYYSLLYGGRAAEAYKFAGDFDTDMKEKLSYVNSGLTHSGLEVGYSFNPDFDKMTTELHDQLPVAEEYGEAFFMKNYHFESIDLNHRVAPAISINHNLTYIGINREQNVDWVTNYRFTSKTSQFQYFLNPQIVLGRRWYVSPSMNLIWGDFSYASGGYRGNSRIFTNTGKSFYDVVASLSASSHFGNFSPGAELNFANISEDNIQQYSLWLTIYPFSNLSFYFTPRVYFKNNEQNSFGYNTFGLSGGLQLGQVHMYGQYLKGDMENFIEASGYIVSNFPGTSDQKISASLYFPLKKKYRFVVRYLMQDITETYLVYTNLARNREMKYDYNKHTITAGISWSF
jgi:hypothetical protein